MKLRQQIDKALNSIHNIISNLSYRSYGITGNPDFWTALTMLEIVVPLLRRCNVWQSKPKREYKPEGTPHIWQDGPDGRGYHCPMCGISRCNDYELHRTCEEWITERAFQIIRNGRKSPDSDLETAGHQWQEYQENGGKL